MQIEILVLGKSEPKWLHQGVEEYLERIGHFNPIHLTAVPPLKKGPPQSPAQQARIEAEQMAKHIKPGDSVVCLDQKGEATDSSGLAVRLNNWRLTGIKKLIFVIGGPYGIGPAVWNLSRHSLSLSNLTFSNQMVRLLFLEQLYRGFTILHNHPYHHGDPAPRK